jgi:hypothetical protein
VGAAPGRVRVWDRLDQRLAVWVPRRCEHLTCGPDLDDPPEVHHCHTLADVFHDRQVVRHEEHRHTQVSLQVGDQVQNLGLHADVESRDRFVGDDQFRIAG